MEERPDAQKQILAEIAKKLPICTCDQSGVFQYFLKFWVVRLTSDGAHTLFGYHCWLVAKNRSMLEAFSAPMFQNGPDGNGFNVGLNRNLQQVFGEDKKLWFIPVFTSQGDGHYFPLRTLRESENPLLANEGERMENGGSDEESTDENGPLVIIRTES
ncbi:palmitoyltransferase ZDHHC15B-like [Carassius gibelio]|uniref:palmitoyltransferase ZDHHC15B-like n=1 Tax=Carassius gibelio TaxID=101364 RepID=UPI0022784AB7|nr:palmitoyltransferase ZDHHC15B-like [Carassius gibelio]